MVTEFLASIPPHTLERVNSLEMQIQSPNCNDAISNLLTRTVLMGGKRLRPLLTYLMGNFFGLSSDRLAVYARSIELVHAASLSHDDVVDGATTRRGNPSINVEASNKRAVLAGDYLLADVIVALTKTGQLKIVQEMAEVISALSEGEWIQLDASESRRYSHDLIEKIALCKTASVMAWCCSTPARLAGHNETLVEYCKSFGENLGVAFQMMDDTLDFSGTSQKDHQLDLKNGIVNSVLYEWLELNSDLKEKFGNGEDIFDLFEQKHLGTAISNIREKSLKKLDHCRELLDVIVNEVASTESERLRMNEQRPLRFMLDFIANRKF